MDIDRAIDTASREFECSGEIANEVAQELIDSAKQLRARVAELEAEEDKLIAAYNGMVRQSKEQRRTIASTRARLARVTEAARKIPKAKETAFHKYFGNILVPEKWVDELATALEGE